MGPYCNYCGTRCFVERRIPGQAGTILMATCQLGALHDMLKTDYDHATAVNPRAIAEEVPDGDPRATGRPGRDHRGPVVESLPVAGH